MSIEQSFDFNRNYNQPYRVSFKFKAPAVWNLEKWKVIASAFRKEVYFRQPAHPIFSQILNLENRSGFIILRCLVCASCDHGF